MVWKSYNLILGVWKNGLWESKFWKLDFGRVEFEISEFWKVGFEGKLFENFEI